MGSESFQVGEHMEVLAELHPREGKVAPCPFPTTPCPMHLFHLAVPELYPFIVNW